MTNADHKRFVTQLAVLCAIFGKEPSKALIEGYWQCLADQMTIEQFEQAAKQAGSQCEFMPPPAKLTQFAGCDLDSQASKAWELVNWAMSAKGGGKNVSFDDPRINATIRAMSGRWDRFIQTYGTREGEQFHRRDFIAEYKRHSGQLGPEASATLSGDTELPEVHHIGSDKTSRRRLAIPRQAVAALLPPRVAQNAPTADPLQQRETLIEVSKQRIAAKVADVNESATDRLRSCVMQRLQSITARSERL